METFEINRIVYNYFVSKGYRDRNEMNYALIELKEQQPILRKYHSKMLQMVSTKVAGARNALSGLKKRGYQAGKGMLKFLDVGECNSFTYNQSGFKLLQYEDGKCILRLSKLGSMEVRIHRRPVNIKQVTIVRQAGR